MKKLNFMIIAASFLAHNVYAQENIEDIHKEIGTAAAKQISSEYKKLDKPKYQQAYDEYLIDLKIIGQTGKAPDNYELYKDLEAMNSDEESIYKPAKSK